MFTRNKGKGEPIWFKNFKENLAESNRFMREELGIKQLILPPQISLPFAPDLHSQEIIDLADFKKAFLHKIYKKDVVNVAVMGPQGRGKTNIFDFPIEFSKILNVPFSWGSNMYLGEGIMIQRKKLVAKHKPGEQVLVDEASFLMRPNSIQKRDFMWTLASIRDAGLCIWVNYPTPKDFDFSIINAHFDFIFMVSYRDQEKRKIKYTLKMRVTPEDQFLKPAWVDYPFEGAYFWHPFLDQSVFDEYRKYKQTIYSIDIEDDWYVEKKKFDKKLRTIAEEKEKKELLEAVEEILKSDLTDTDKVIGLHKAGYPKFLIAERLPVSYRKITLILEDELMIEGIESGGKPREERDIFISTKRENIENELLENMDPDFEDFWPVSNWPKDMIEGESRLYLTVGQEKVASFIIEGKDEREWRGRMKKVLLLKKESGRREEGKIAKPAAPMGGYRYI